MINFPGALIMVGFFALIGVAIYSTGGGEPLFGLIVAPAIAYQCRSGK